MKHLILSIALLALMFLQACTSSSDEPPIRHTLVQFSEAGDTLLVCHDAYHLRMTDNGMWFNCGRSARQFVSGTIQVLDQ